MPTPAPRFTALMAVGLAPVSLWLLYAALMVLNAARYPGSLDLTGLTILGVSGFLTYVIACAVSGIAALMAFRAAHQSGRPLGRAATLLTITPMVIMLAPWGIWAAGMLRGASA